MQKKIDEHQFVGMQRDMTISKQKPEFLWDAHNIRLTARHGDTLLSITNERGTKQINNVEIKGVVLGYCVLGDYLTLFTTDINQVIEQNQEPKPDHIYRLQKIEDTISIIELYNGNLNFKVNNPIECLGIYENEKIQKVYWTDGVNQPRLINITKQLLDGIYTDTSFDFIPTLSLNDSIHVKKIADSSGIFAAGVIQYAVTYYDKYGQESNVSIVSPLIPTSYTSRAGGPEDTIGNAFKVTVKNPDTLFEFMRIYSIFRSSKNTTPVCKRVADVRLGYGGRTSTELHISNDSHNEIFVRYFINSLKLKESYNTAYTQITNYLQYKGTEDIRIKGVQFISGLYYHFTKDELPYLIIKAMIYDNATQQINTRSTFLTWGTCKDLYISTEAVLGPGKQNYPIILAASGEMIAANDIHYSLNEFVDEDISVTITDNGTIGEEIEYNELLFVGGETITAGTLTQKDGTMFLGDIKISRPQITGDYKIVDRSQLDTISNIFDNIEEDPNVVSLIRKGVTSINCTTRTTKYPLTMNSSTYKWGNTLDATTVNGKESTNIAGFKIGEHYRLGLQFLYKTGKWSQPVFIEDKINESNRPSITIDSAGIQCTQTIPTFEATLHQDVGLYMLSNDYKRMRAVVCFPTESDQLIACQGLLNPTVFSIGGKESHTPDIQSSWFFRPIPSTNDDENPITELYAGQGAIVQYKNNYTLWSGYEPNHVDNPGGYIPTRRDEIQSATPEYSNKLYPGGVPNTPIGFADLNNIFVVDWEYLTLHSPEFEFNDSFHNLDTATLNCKLIGLHILRSNQGDIHITTSTGSVHPYGPGFYHRIIQSWSRASRINAGLFYRDGNVKKDGTSEGEAESIYSYLIHPWHRYGSLNNSGEIYSSLNPLGNVKRSAMLDQKKMTNLMWFSNMRDIPANFEYHNKVFTTPLIKIFNSDLISLVKINDQNYFGNVDQVLSSQKKYGLGFAYIVNGQGAINTQLGDFEQDLYYAGNMSGYWGNDAYLGVSADPVYMKYKSTPHAVIHTSSSSFGYPEPTGQDDPLQGEFPRYTDGTGNSYPYLFCAELQRPANANTDFGGTSAHAIQHNLWYPAGPPVKIGCTVDGTTTLNGTTVIPFWYGDTYYQRYDCLKTYPFTDEDSNSIIEIGSFMVETRINLDGRYDKHRANVSNFLLNPTNYNLINPVYSQMDNFFNYRILDADYYALNDYPTMVSWTSYKNNAAEVDNWTNITLASTLEMDGTKGRVNAIRVNSDQLYCFQDDAIGLILFNSRVQISPSDGVPIEISNNYKVDGNRYISTTIGCKNKWTIIEGIDGLYFIDDNTKALYQIGGLSQMKPISAPLNMSYWFMNQSSDAKWIQRYYDGNWEMPQRGIRCFYDKANADLYICTPDETLCYSEKLGQFISFFDYHNVIGMFNIDSEYYALNYSDITPSSGIKLWGMFQGLYNCIFDKIYSTDFTFISNENPLNDKIFTNIDLRGDFRLWYHNDIKEDFNSPTHIVDHIKMFDTLQVWNEYQDTGITDINFTKDVVSNMKKKFRIWRMDIQRDKSNSINRIRNTWAKIKFTMNTLSDVSLQDLCGTVTDEFIVWDSNSMSWTNLDFRNREGHEFAYNEEGGYIQEDELNAEHFHSVYQYRLNGNVITRTIAGQTSITQPYAYRKLYDMEIHDIGVVYFV